MFMHNLTLTQALTHTIPDADPDPTSNSNPSPKVTLIFTIEINLTHMYQLRARMRNNPLNGLPSRGVTRQLCLCIT